MPTLVYAVPPPQTGGHDRKVGGGTEKIFFRRELVPPPHFQFASGASDASPMQTQSITHYSDINILWVPRIARRFAIHIDTVIMGGDIILPSGMLRTHTRILIKIRGLTRTEIRRSAHLRLTARRNQQSDRASVGRSLSAIDSLSLTVCLCALLNCAIDASCMPSRSRAARF